MSYEKRGEASYACCLLARLRRRAHRLTNPTTTTHRTLTRSPGQTPGDCSSEARIELVKYNTGGTTLDVIVDGIAVVTETVRTAKDVPIQPSFANDHDERPMSLHRITTGKTPRNDNPYSQGVRTGGTVYVSGYGPVDPETDGKIDGGIQDQTQQVLDNVAAVVSRRPVSGRRLRSETIRGRPVHRDCVLLPRRRRGRRA